MSDALVDKRHDRRVTTLLAAPLRSRASMASTGKHMHNSAARVPPLFSRLKGFLSVGIGHQGST